MSQKGELMNVIIKFIIKFISQSLMTGPDNLDNAFGVERGNTYSSQEFIHLLVQKRLNYTNGFVFFHFYSAEVNSVDFGARLPGFELQLCHLEAV